MRSFDAICRQVPLWAPSGVDGSAEDVERCIAEHAGGQLRFDTFDTLKVLMGTALFCCCPVHEVAPSVKFVSAFHLRPCKRAWHRLELSNLTQPLLGEANFEQQLFNQ